MAYISIYIYIYIYLYIYISLSLSLYIYDMYIFACLGFLESQKGELTMASGFRVKQDSKAWLRGFTQGPPLSAEQTPSKQHTEVLESLAPRSLGPATMEYL